MADTHRRIAIEFTETTSADLDWLCVADALNPTTVVNRAVQVYRLIREHNAALLMEDPSGRRVVARVEPVTPLEDRPEYPPRPG